MLSSSARTLAGLILLLLILNLAVTQTRQQQQYNPYQNVVKIKAAGFRDPHTGYVYRVESYNVSALQPTSYPAKGFIRISRVKVSELTGQPVGEPENLQTLNFKPTLVDFDLHCEPSHCYLVAISGRSKRNVELYAWSRTQFDLLATVDSFALPHSVKLFMIRPNEFYIAIAQDQLHLSSSRFNLQTGDDDDQLRFIGCAILKFTRDKENPPQSSNHKIKYHQFIKLPYNPLHVNHFTSINQNNFTTNVKPYENHYLVFSLDHNWNEASSSVARTFIWSPLNDYFWPHRLPREVVVEPPASKLGTYYPLLKFPNVYDGTRINQTAAGPLDWNQPVEACFNQLQRLLSERDLHARQLLQASQSFWKSPKYDQGAHQNDLTSISARVIVHGNVIVRGSLVDSPQMTLFGLNRLPANELSPIMHLIDAHSPAIVENRLLQAKLKLNHIRDKLQKAVNVAGNLGDYNFNSRIRFFGNLLARKVVFGGNGIANANVKLNGIQYSHLEHELVGFRGAQEIVPRVIFRGNVVADLLEIHGVINKQFYLRDAVDIDSKQMQVIKLYDSGYHGPNSAVGLEFSSIVTKDVIMAYNATINGIRLNEFITRDNRTQFIYGRKSFRNLGMAQLSLNHPNVPLNGHNITNIGLKAIQLRMAHNYTQLVYGNHMTFSRPIKVGRLFINNLINRYINVSSIVHDSVKADDMSVQHISGHKYFANGLRINQLVTEGAINHVPINQVFNLNAAPPTADLYGLNNTLTTSPIIGNFEFNSTVTIQGNLNAGLINNVDISKRAIRRFPGKDTPIQYVSGKKIFFRPIRVLNNVHLLNSPNTSTRYPTVNGIDLKSITSGIRRQVENPPLIYIDNLEIDGNLNLPTSPAQYQNGTIAMASRVTLGNYKSCPLDLIRSKLIVGGHLNQVIDVPIRIESLRAKSIQLQNPFSLNNLNFPNDFVLRSSVSNGASDPRYANVVEPIFGHKYIEHLRIAPSMQGSPILPLHSNNILFGSRSTINNITYDELQTFILQERQRNSTGETVLQVMNVHGNVFARRINGQYWPEDILLKSIAANPYPGQASNSPYLHKRIYSPLIFLEPNLIEVENQLVLRGPIQLNGRLNGINLTEFSRSTVTYGDKDLLLSGRPIRNKNFLGGISVRGQFRSEGFINGINIDLMRDRVVTIGPNQFNGRKTQIFAPKAFLGDINFLGPISTIYLNDMIIDNYLNRVRVYQQENMINNVVQILGKKTITGTLNINKNLFVQGLINGIDFIDLQAKAVSLPQTKAISLPQPNDMHLVRQGYPSPMQALPLVRVGFNYPPATAITLAKLAQRPPASLQYELFAPQQQQQQQMSRPEAILNDSHVQYQLQLLRSQIVSLNLMRNIAPSNLVVGFIPSPSNDLSNFMMPEQDPPHSGHSINVKSFLQLDQIDYPFRPTTYHLAVGLSNSNDERNVTSVFSSVAAGEPKQVSVLPIESPNNAMFLKIEDLNTLFLIVSQDYTINARNHGSQCPRYWTNSQLNSQFSNPTMTSMESYNAQQLQAHHQSVGGIHIYLFHALQNTSIFSNVYFDLYQTIDLPAVDSFEKFQYGGSTYALTISRLTGKIHLLLVRGYSGFQLVSYIDAPDVESVKILYTYEKRPVLVIYQSNGLHRVMDPVII